MANRRVMLAVAAFGWFSCWLGGVAGWLGPSGVPGIAIAAESLNIEGLSKDPKAYRAQVEQILKKVDGLIEKLKGHQSAHALVLDLEQTRDNILREIPKMEVAPGDAKWGAQEMRDSVQAMLKLLKDQYEKAAGMAG
ncbi:MAG: hypothetical protein KGO52_16985 [Nitrospirota bacterium]|nr:hypothetical protein [Nitrospirota bacterium]